MLTELKKLEEAIYQLQRLKRGPGCDDDPTAFESASRVAEIAEVVEGGMKAILEILRQQNERIG